MTAPAQGFMTTLPDVVFTMDEEEYGWQLESGT